MEQKIKEIVARLDELAAKNEDEFSYSIEIVKLRRGTPNLRFHFVCKESAEGHVFVDGQGWNISDAVDEAAKAIEAACVQWGYKYAICRP
jgi:hypothetical protein